MKTSELQGAALDWAVNQIEECCDDPFTPMFSTDWVQGGPIIERERIALDTWDEGWLATRIEDPAISEAIGPTPLIAAMRCYVASRLGDEVEVPNELMEV
jgi:hypothetical protein